MRKRRSFDLIAVLVFGLVLLGTRPAQADEPNTPGKGKRAQEFLDAFHKGDARALAGFWAPDGDYIDQAGRQFKGRPAIEKMYEKAFAAQKGGKLTITVKSVRMVTSDVAIENGLTEVTPADGGPPAVAQFSAVLVKKDGTWYFESVRESPAQPPSNFRHLEDLDWLIGDWTSGSEKEEKGEAMRASYSWAENQNFLVSSFATTLNGIPVVGGTQWIGWDAVDKQVRSWSFYSGGGFGEAVWTREGNKWTIKTTARTADGKKASVTNVLTRVDADHATWQATHLTVDGKEMPDSPPVKLRRIKGDRP